MDLIMELGVNACSCLLLRGYLVGLLSYPFLSNFLSLYVGYLNPQLNGI